MPMTSRAAPIYSISARPLETIGRWREPGKLPLPALSRTEIAPSETYQRWTKKRAKLKSRRLWNPWFVEECRRHVR